MYREQEFQFVYERGVLRPQIPLDLPEGARGIASIRQNGRSGTGPDEFWTGASIRELAERQGAEPVANPLDLAGDWPAEDSLDVFLDEVRRGRC